MSNKHKNKNLTSTLKTHVLTRNSNHVGSTFTLQDQASTWRIESVQDYINTLQHLQRNTKKNQTLMLAREEQDKQLATKQKLKQEQRRWYLPELHEHDTSLQASAIMLDFDQPKNQQVPVADLFTDVCNALDQPNAPYCVISTTSSNGVHVVIPTKHYFPLELQPVLSTAFAKHFAINVEQDEQATGGEGKGFFDPRHRVCDLRIKIQDNDIFDHDILPTPKDLKKSLTNNFSDLYSFIQTTLTSNELHDKLSKQLKLLLEENEAEEIIIKPANKKLLGVVGTYKLNGTKCKAICYANGVMIGTPWDKKDRETTGCIYAYDRVDTRIELAKEIAQQYITAQIQNSNERWYYCDNQWRRERSFVVQVASALDQGWGFVVKHEGSGSSLSWVGRLKETRELVVRAFHELQPTHIIKSQLKRNINQDVIWNEFGEPKRLQENIHVLETRNITTFDVASVQDTLGYPINGYELSRNRWQLQPVRKRTEMTQWHKDHKPDTEARLGYIQSGWTRQVLAKHLGELPATVVVIIKDVNDTRCCATTKDPHRYTRELTLCRQRIHAASLRGTHVIVIISANNYEAYKALNINQTATRMKMQDINKYAIKLPEVK